MRFIFKTSYQQDLSLFRDNFQRNWYLALLAGLFVLPIMLPDYLVDFSLVLIYGLCALSLMVLAGYTGLVSLGHAAFLGIGAYAFFAGFGPALDRLLDVGHRSRSRGRCARWSAGIAHDRHLSGHRYARLRTDHPGSI
jgi:hypothetical protein